MIRIERERTPSTYYYVFLVIGVLPETKPLAEMVLCRTRFTAMKKFRLQSNTFLFLSGKTAKVIAEKETIVTICIRFLLPW
jgi:hypothetical protein